MFLKTDTSLIKFEYLFNTNHTFPRQAKIKVRYQIVFLLLVNNGH
jgi:hypothetical protein